MATVFILYIIAATICGTHSINITLMPTPGYSHHKAAAILGKELSRRGHTVTLFNHFNDSSIWENITTYAVISKLDKNYFSKYKINPGQTPLLKSVHMSMAFLNIVFELRQCSFDLIDDPRAMSILSETDLIIGEIALKHPLYMAKYFKKPLIGYQQLPTKMVNAFLRIPASETYVPVYNTWHTDRMSVFQKLFQYFCNHLVFNVFLVMIDYQYKIIRDKLGLDHLADVPNYDLIITQYSPLLEYPQPTHSNMFNVGPWTNEPGKTLPVQFDEFLSSTESGFILVSFGTAYTLEEDSEDVFTSLTNVLSKLDYKVILTGKNGTSNKNFSSNLLVVNFAPQNDLLAHPKIKLFVTHAGMMSVRETCYHGVPVLVIPRGIDQHDNGVTLVERLKMGIMIEFNMVNFQALLTLIPKIIQDKSYKENAQRCSQIMKSQPYTYPRERAADIIEEFIRWDYNASHLRPHVLDMGWYEYYALDVIFTIILLPAFVIILVRKCLDMKS